MITVTPSAVQQIRIAASQSEADELWPVLEQQWPHYRDYEKTAKRDIRVFHLVPAEADNA